MTKDKEMMSAFEDPPQESKLMRKVRESPFMPIGITGCLFAVVYGIYNFKRKGTMSTSVYLMHLRVKAQGMVVGALTIGAGYNIYKNNFAPKEVEEKEEEHHHKKKK